MKHELPEAEWYFAKVEDHLSLIKHVRMVIWSKGICLGGYDEHNRALTGKVFLWSDEWNTDRLTQIFENEPMVAGPQPITHIWISTEQQLQVPAPLFDLEKAGSWLQQFHFIEADYSIYENTPVKTKSAPRIVYAAPGNVLYKLDRFFPEARIDILSSALIHSLLQEQEDKLLLSLLNQTVSVTWVQQQQLKYFQLFPYQSCEDILYKLTQITQQLGADLQQLPVSYQGVVPTEISRELPAYLKGAKIYDQEHLLFTFLNQLAPCAL